MYFRRNSFLTCVGYLSGDGEVLGNGCCDDSDGLSNTAYYIYSEALSWEISVSWVIWMDVVGCF